MERTMQEVRIQRLSRPVWRRARKGFICDSCQRGIPVKGLYIREVWAIGRKIHVDRRHFPFCQREIDTLF